ncbi:MAG: FkbM family methyltransferase [Lachnospiraceae bacterium]|nr:FkbM family methyltransferase [Lachnospiraceae bacterium]
MHIDEMIVEAQNRFIEECWKHFRDFASKTENYNIFIYGSGIYGRFLFNALTDIGLGKSIKAFLNDFANEQEIVLGRPVQKPSEVSLNSDDDIVVVGIQDNGSIIEFLERSNIRYISADYVQWFYQNNLMYTVYRCIEVSSITDMVFKIDFYYRNMYGKDKEILDLYDEPLSKEIIKNRLLFYRTGDCSYIESTVKNYTEYFHEEYFHISDNEVYVDVGAFDGDSIEAFTNYTDGKYSKIVAIEPDRMNYEKLEKSVGKYQNCMLLRCATGDCNDVAVFEAKGTMGSSLGENGEEVEIRKLDDILEDTHPTLIKMDIEGAEFDTLKGSVKIIMRDKPKLIVCLYHKMEDIINIPRFIHEIVPEYKFKVRQHSNTMWDTVLYAEV